MRFSRVLLLATIAALSCLWLAGCGTVSKVTGGTEKGASSDVEAWKVDSKDPLARPIQIAWTSARAKYCGFMFSPDALKANYLAAERQLGQSDAKMRKIEEAYDYTFSSVTDKISHDTSYCNKPRTDAIRGDLQAYLGGNFAHRATMAQ